MTATTETTAEQALLDAFRAGRRTALARAMSIPPINPCRGER
jgi:hypothetical protein